MNEQETFDFVVASVLKQGEPSINVHNPGTGSLVCAYRSSSGLKCAAGFLIPDELYRAGFEGKTIVELVNLGLVKIANLALVSQLQAAHDWNAVAGSDFVSHFKKECRIIARIYRLEWKFETNETTTELTP